MPARDSEKHYFLFFSFFVNLSARILIFKRFSFLESISLFFFSAVQPENQSYILNFACFNLEVLILHLSAPDSISSLQPASRKPALDKAKNPYENNAKYRNIQTWLVANGRVVFATIKIVVVLMSK